MIGSLRGRLLRKEASLALVETGGVGYRLHIPFSTFFKLGEVGQESQFLVHTHVRDDAIQLFGFATELELKTFERLIDVTGVGPRLALTILSGIPAGDLIEAIRGENVRRLCAVPGLGKKTSERLILELREKLDGLQGSAPASSQPRAKPGAHDDAVSALVNLGYRSADAEAAVTRAEGLGVGRFEDLLRAALQSLAR